MSFHCQGMESPRSCMPTRRAAVRISGASSCQQGSSPAQEGRCCRRSVLEPECTHNDIERHAVSTTNLNKLTLGGHGNMRKYIDMHSSMFLFLSLSLSLSPTLTHRHISVHRARAMGQGKRGVQTHLATVVMPRRDDRVLALRL